METSNSNRQESEMADRGTVSRENDSAVIRYDEDGEPVMVSKIIKLDIDGKLDFKRLESVIEKLKEMKCVLTKGEVWKSPHGYHVYIWTESITETYLPCVQALMGSDWKRELLNFERVLKDEPGWNVLFQEKEKFDKDKTATLRRVLL